MRPKTHRHIESTQNTPIIPEFEMLRRIGGGSYGEVWLARSVTGALRAVKIVRREDFDLERTFEREFSGIQHYERVSQAHAGLVDVLHVGRNRKAGFYYYVMELADDVTDGQDFEVEEYQPRTLAADLKKLGPLALDSCIDTGRLLASALGHLHRNGLTHRDVKPSNIIFVRGAPQMADIGLVASSGQRSYVGTEGYVPPEGPGTAVADLYSLAMVMYEMHTGKDRLEFPELPTNLELPRTVNRDQWRALNNVICRAGSPDPKKRFETAEVFVAALSGVNPNRSGLGGAAGAELEHARRRRKWMLATVSALVLAVAFGAWGMMQAFAPKDTDLVDTGAQGSATGGDGKNTSTPAETGGQTAAVPMTIVSSVSRPLDNKEKDASAPVISDEKSSSSSDTKAMLAVGNGEEPQIGQREGDAAKDTVGSPASADGEPLPTMALVKVISDTAGAAILQGETLLGYTPTGYLELPPGDIELMLRMEGYHDEVIERELQPGDNPYIYATMRQDRRPIPGQAWSNSLGLHFIYEGEVGSGDGVHITEGVVGVAPVAEFFKAVGRGEEPLVELQGATALGEPDQWEFCDWMTRQDRREGFLAEGEYHRPQRTLTKGMEGAFYCVIDRRFGEAEINSEPPGATVLRDGKAIGVTPLVLAHERGGPLRVSLDAPGFRSAVIEGSVQAGRRAYLSQSLERDDSLVFGQPWPNSLGMSLVPVGDFMASVFETRVQDYAAFVASPEGAEHAPLDPEFAQADDHPVVGVGLEDARAFCRWLTEKERGEGRIDNHHEYRLPSDLEWSLMAGLEDEGQETPEKRDSRAPRGDFPWGTDWPPPPGSGNFLDESTAGKVRQPVLKGYNDGFEKTSPVGKYDANRYGLHDLAGNVWEWVDDLYGGEGSSLATLRGGGFNVSEKSLLLTGYRNAVSTNMRDWIYGFRCVLVEDKGLAEAAWGGDRR